MSTENLSLTNPEVSNLTENKTEMKHSIPDQKYEITSISRKLPPFWKNDPGLWFAQIEAVFSTHRISMPLTMFQYVVSNLDIDVLAQVADLVKNPGRNPYEDIKKRLIQVYGDSEHKRITKLLESTQLGNQKPSAFLRQMSQLANQSVPEDMLRTLWLRNLPSRVQSILAATSHTDVEQLAQIADKIMEVDNHTEIYSTEPKKDLLCQLTSQMAQIRIQLDNLERRLNQRDRHFSRGRSPYRQDFKRDSSTNRNFAKNRNLANNRVSPQRSPTRSDKCFYHTRFGAQAQKCTQPCSWVTQDKKNLN